MSMKLAPLGLLLASGLVAGCIITIPPATSDSASDDDGQGPTDPTAPATSSSSSSSSSSTSTADPTSAGTTLDETTGLDTDPTTTGASPACDDGLQNGDETDLDCGGSCAPCALGQACQQGSDCQSAVCEGGACAPAPACDDGVQNGDESDLDCGGSCMPCPVGGACQSDDDCVGTCTDNLCDPVTCESDADCVKLDTECAVGTCVKGSCAPEAIQEGEPCDDFDLCTDATACQAGVCAGGVLPDCSGLDDACNLGACDPQDGLCKPQPVADDTPCDDGEPCTLGELCQAGACVDKDGPDHLLYDGFADNSQGWTFFNTAWQIGPAQAGCGDPGADHSPTDDNGVAGTVLGGCVAAPGGHALLSPKLDASGQTDLWLSFYYFLNSDNPVTETRLEVFDGGKWVYLDAFPPMSSLDWAQASYDLTPYASPDLQVRWWHTLLADQPPPVGGWNIDDVVLGPPACAPF